MRIHDHDALYALKTKLNFAIANKRSAKWCLSLWSKFITTRDARRCVKCRSIDGIQAHHIFRKTTYPWGAFELGNGITLCRTCHNYIHENFNGRPNYEEPLDMRGGDNQDVIAELYGLLLHDAVERNLPENDFYYICDHMLTFFVKIQGYERFFRLMQEGQVTRIKFAHEIWISMPELFYTNFAKEIIRLN